MTIISQILSLYIWSAAGILMLFVFVIARFFDKRRREQIDSDAPYPLHWWLLGAVVCFLAAAIWYAIAGNIHLVGIPGADGLRVIGGIVVTFVGISLLNTMVGGRS